MVGLVVSPSTVELGVPPVVEGVGVVLDSVTEVGLGVATAFVGLDVALIIEEGAEGTSPVADVGVTAKGAPVREVGLAGSPSQVGLVVGPGGGGGGVNFRIF